MSTETMGPESFPTLDLHPGGYRDGVIVTFVAVARFDGVQMLIVKSEDSTQYRLPFPDDLAVYSGEGYPDILLITGGGDDVTIQYQLDGIWVLPVMDGMNLDPGFRAWDRENCFEYPDWDLEDRIQLYFGESGSLILSRSGRPRSLCKVLPRGIYPN